MPRCSCSRPPVLQSNAWARALDLGLLGGPGATAALSAGAYALLVLTVLVFVALVGGIGRVMVRSARAEEERATAMMNAVPDSAHRATDHAAPMEQCAARHLRLLLPLQSLTDCRLLQLLRIDNTALSHDGSLIAGSALSG